MCIRDRLKSTVETSLRLEQSEFERLTQAISQLTAHEKERLMEVTAHLKQELSSRTLKGIAFQVATDFLVGGLSPTTADFITAVYNPDVGTVGGRQRQVLLNRVAALENALKTPR